MKTTWYRYILIIAVLMISVIKGNSQRPIPDELINNSIEGQINYLEERTRIYENYRAIREDMFQKVNDNVLDSLNTYKGEIETLSNRIIALSNTRDSLNNSLEQTKTSLQEVTRTKNQISLFGLAINKTVYNSVLFIIIGGLLLLLVIGFVWFKRNRLVTINTRKEINDLKDEFEEYRQTSRRAREKMTMEHFKEMQRLKEK